MKKQQAVKDEDWNRATRLRDEMKLLRGRLSKLPVCKICHIFKPSPHALKSCSETSFKEGKCLWCRGSDIKDNVDMSLDSLRKRTNAEINEAKPFFDKNLSKKKQRVFKQFLKQNKIPVGPGCGRRLGRQSTTTKAGIQAQLFRTLQRIQFDFLKGSGNHPFRGFTGLGRLLMMILAYRRCNSFKCRPVKLRIEVTSLGLLMPRLRVQFLYR